MLGFKEPYSKKNKIITDAKKTLDRTVNLKYNGDSMEACKISEKYLNGTRDF